MMHHAISAIFLFAFLGAWVAWAHFSLKRSLRKTEEHNANMPLVQFFDGRWQTNFYINMTIANPSDELKRLTEIAKAKLTEAIPLQSNEVIRWVGPELGHLTQYDAVYGLGAEVIDQGPEAGHADAKKEEDI